MARTRKEEERLLSADEHALVLQTRRPALGSLPDKELGELLKRLRGARDRARDIAGRQRREFRGKAAPSGVRPATDNSGTQGKRDVLAAAVKRGNRETERRRSKAARSDLSANAARALAMKRSADKPERPSSRTAHEGMQSLPNTGIAPSGALNAEGHRPVLERSRKVR